jgi:enamine deaminase RidA (YjgF/YER057c/UK114 family)
VTVYVTDIRAYDEIEDIRNHYFHANPPASVIVEVSKLARPEWIIEIEAIAALG